MQEITASPISNQRFTPETMNFAEALDHLLANEKIRRKEWTDDGIYLVMADDKIMIFKPEDDMLHPLIVSRGDLLATDWSVISKEN